MGQGLYETLKDLYRRQLALTDLPYLRDHSRDNSIRREIEAFERYRRFLPASGAMLDWGCGHAATSCIIRAALGPGLALHGCDFQPEGTFREFKDFAGLLYRQLNDPVALPYPPDSFGAVIGSGVLEHVAMDVESLKEVRRVLKPGGVFVAAFLPNRFSYSEAISRLILRRGYHSRRYGRRRALAMFRCHGLQPIWSGYHQFVPAQKCQGVLGPLWPLNRFFEAVPPFRWLCANITIVAKKVADFT